MTPFVRGYQIGDDQCPRWHPNAEVAVDSEAIDGEHLHHREMHNFAHQLTLDLLLDPLPATPTDDVAFNKSDI